MQQALKLELKILKKLKIPVPVSLEILLKLDLKSILLKRPLRILRQYKYIKYLKLIKNKKSNI